MRGVAVFTAVLCACAAFGGEPNDPSVVPDDGGTDADGGPVDAPAPADESALDAGEAGEVDAAPVLKRFFLSSQPHDGKLSGDAFCRQLASGASRPNASAYVAIYQRTPSDDPFAHVKPGGIWRDFADRVIFEGAITALSVPKSPITVTELGVPLGGPSSISVWTGSDGAHLCNQWLSNDNAVTGAIGLAGSGAVPAAWFASSEPALGCGADSYVYCAEP